MMRVHAIIDGLIGREGGYSNHPSDRGGETMWGVTIATARKHGYRGPMRDMPRPEACRIYYDHYFKKPGFEAVGFLSEPVAVEMFDTGVNMGPSWAAIFLQTALTRLNRRAKDYPNLKVDGDVGPATLSALKAFLKRRGKDGEGVLLKALDVQQGARYFDITPEDDQNEDFLYGWLRTRVGTLA